jgi:hypothetical protein
MTSDPDKSGARESPASQPASRFAELLSHLRVRVSLRRDIRGPHVGLEQVLLPGLVKVYVQADREFGDAFETSILIEVQPLCLCKQSGVPG